MDSSLLAQNNMQYVLPKPSSVVTGRCLKRQYPQQRTATAGQTITFTLNTGTSMVDQWNSSLVITVTTAGGADYACSFGRGSACNLIENIRIYSRSGVQITNTTHYNLFRKIFDRYEHSGDWFGNVGTLCGYNQTSDAFAAVGDQTISFVIPLTKVHPFFDEMSKRFLPPSLASGMRIEIDLAALGTAFVSDADVGAYPDSVTGYTVDDVYLNLEEVQIMSSAQATLNKVASEQTLEYTFSDIFTSRNSTATNTTINLDINKSVSFAQKAFTVLQTAADITDLTDESFDSLYRNGDWWYQLGSDYLPSNQLIDNFKVAYMCALATWNKLKKPFQEGDVALTDFNVFDGVYAVSLERSDSLALSSLPINSSRQLRFQLTLATAPPAAQVSTTYLQYLCNVRSTLLNCKVDT